MAFIFKIKLEGTSKPPVWRKVKVDENMNFDDFHMLIQVVFNWNNSHMYQFSPKGYGSNPSIKFDYKDDFDFDSFEDKKYFPVGECFHSEDIKLKDYFHTIKQKLIYIYDFGDDWKHSIVLESIEDEKILFPMLVSGKGKAPIDDCGGVWGYYEMVNAINDSKHPEHKNYKEWLGFKRGFKWDINEFDLKEEQEVLLDTWQFYLEELDKLKPKS